MDPLHALIDTAGFCTRAEALAVGYDDRDLQRLVRHGVLHRIRRGAYTTSVRWAALDAEGQHLLRCDIVLRSLGPAVCLSHVSAALVHGATTWGVPLARVHVTRLDGGAGRVEGDVVHHEGFCLDGDVVEVAGRPVTRPARSALEAASQGTPEAALSLLDSFLHQGLVSDKALAAQFTTMQHWPRLRRLHVPVWMADGRSASVGESRGRWLFWSAGLPAPVLQYEVHAADGRLIGATDWAWPDHGVLGEFDGQAKYGRLLKPGQASGEAVFAEKVREDELRAQTGMTMLRLTWADYQRPRVTTDRVGAVLGLPSRPGEQRRFR